MIGAIRTLAAIVGRRTRVNGSSTTGSEARGSGISSATRAVSRRFPEGALRLISDHFSRSQTAGRVATRRRSRSRPQVKPRSSPRRAANPCGGPPHGCDGAHGCAPRPSRPSSRPQSRAPRPVSDRAANAAPTTGRSAGSSVLPCLWLARAETPDHPSKARRENGRGSSASIRPSVCLESCVIRSLEPKSNQPRLGLLEAWALWCQTLTAFGATAFEHVLTTGGGGAGTESVRFRTLTAVWLPSTFHRSTPPRNARFSNEKWSEPRQINTPFGASLKSLARDRGSSKPQIRNLRATTTEARS
jgi:hypothetical protein